MGQVIYSQVLNLLYLFSKFILNKSDILLKLNYLFFLFFLTIFLTGCIGDKTFAHQMIKHLPNIFKCEHGNKIVIDGCGLKMNIKYV